MQTPWPEPGHATAADLAACRTMLRDGSRTFFAASLLLPREVRAAASSLYAFCRLSDDAVDLRGGRLDAVARLAERLDRVYAGRPAPQAVDRALADVVARHAVPRALPDALLEGLAWDALGRRYEDLRTLQDYAARVAGTVGSMMAVLMGVRSPEAIARACDLGVAMQLTNIARDVGEDARAGRVYLPLAWLREAGIEPARWLARPVFSPALGAVVARLLDEAELLYGRAADGVAHLPPACRPAIHAARLLYAEIGREVARAGHDSITARAVVADRRKLRLVGVALLATAAARPPGRVAPALEATRFLVEAVARTPAPLPSAAAAAIPWWNLDERFGRVVELFHRLEQREQPARSAGRS